MSILPNIRIFISSPGDVAEERVIAGRILKRVADRFASVANLQPIFWEHEPLLATADFQSQIPRPSAAEIFICILWSRLGTRLPSSVRRNDGSTFQSGTEYEFEDAISSYRKKGMPDLIVYRKTADPVISLRDRNAVREALRQGELLDTFIQQWFHGEDGTLKAAFHPFRDPSEFEEHLELHLVKLIGRRLKQAGVAQSSPGRVTWTAGSPYRGLGAFEIEHEPIFFGRTTATSSALRALREQAADNRPFLMVLGASGSGKSSLVKAGLLPMLTRPGVVPGVTTWKWAIMRPSDASGNLFLSLVTALLRPEALPDLLPNQVSIVRLTELCTIDPEQVLKRLAVLLAGKSGNASHKLALVIDQLEEVFTLGNITAAERESFFSFVEKLAMSGVWVITTLRSDFYHLCADIPEISRLKAGSGQYDVQPPTPTEISAIIRQPAIAAGLRFEQSRDQSERLLDLLADDAIRCPESLPLLSFTLDELYSRRSDQNNLRLSVYHQLGRLEGALAHRAGEVFTTMPQNVQAALPRVFRQLVTLSADDDGKVVRRPAPIGVFKRDKAATQFLNAFIEARLFSTKQAADGTPIVEITHEALLTRWKPVQKWLKIDREHLRVLGRVKNAARVWDESKRSSDRLLSRGQPLDEAKRLLDAGFELSASERGLIDASRRRVWRNRQVRRLAVSALVVLTFISGIGFILAESNRNRAEQNFNASRKTVDEFVTEISREELSVIPGLQELRQKFAQRAVDRYAEFALNRPRDPGVRSGLAQAKISLGQVMGGIGSVEQAVAELKQATELLETNVAQGASHEHMLQYARAQNELAKLYWSLNFKQIAVPLVDQSIRTLEEILLQDDSNLEAKYELGVAYNIRGNCRRETGDETGYKDYEKSKERFLEIVDRHSRKADCYAGLSAAVHNLHFHYRTRKDYSRALNLLDESRKYDEIVLELTPTAPQAVSNQSIGHSNRGYVLRLMGKRAEADLAYEAAESDSRRVVAENPKVTRYQSLLADTLKSYSEHLTAGGKFPEARKKYEEAIAVLESVVNRVDDRPSYAVTLIEVRAALASFHSGTPEAGGKRDENAYMKTLDEVVDTAKRCSTRFPASVEVQFQLAKALYARSEVDFTAERWDPVYKRVKEACNIYESMIANHTSNLNDERTIAYADWLGRIIDVADKRKDRELALSISQKALAIADRINESEGSQTIGRILGNWGRNCEENDELKKAIDAYESELRICIVPFEKAPWHWYLRSNVAGAYLHLSDLYEKVGDTEKEVRARQNWLRLWGGYFCGMKTESFIDPDRVPSEAEARRLRDHMKKKPGMKKFTVPCDFNGLKFPFEIYISDNPWPRDPLEDQAKWLEEIRGGKIPEDVRESFRKLHELAHKNNVSYQELCVYALAEAAKGSDQPPASPKPVVVVGREEQAVAYYREKGCLVTIDQKSPGRPVVGLRIKAKDDLDAVELSMSLSEQLDCLPNLSTLAVEGIPAKDADFGNIWKRLTNLRSLNLDGTEITDQTLKAIESLPLLETLSVRWTKVKPTGINSLQRARPKLKIVK